MIARAILPSWVGTMPKTVLHEEKLSETSRSVRANVSSRAGMHYWNTLKKYRVD